MLLHRIRYRIRYIAGGFGIFLLFFIIGMMFLNHYAREQPDYWQFFSKCEACMGSFVRGQTETLSVIYFYVFFLMCFAFTGPRVESKEEKRLKKKLEEEKKRELEGAGTSAEPTNKNNGDERASGYGQNRQLQKTPINAVDNRPRNMQKKVQNQEEMNVVSNQVNLHGQEEQPEQNKIREDSDGSRSHGIIDVDFHGRDENYIPPPKAVISFTLKEHVFRYLIYLALHIPGLVVMAIFNFYVKLTVRDQKMSLIGQCFLYLVFYGIGTALIGGFMVGMRNIVFKKVKLYYYNDSLYFPNLLKLRQDHEDEIEVKIDEDALGHHHAHINRMHSQNLHHNSTERVQQPQENFNSEQLPLSKPVYSPNHIPQNEINHHSVPADDHPAHPSKSKPVIQNDA